MSITRHKSPTRARAPQPEFRMPTSEDGAAVWKLIKDCAPLDRNSLYCNLLQCDHFADTCVVVELEGEIVGWVSGYIVPDQTDTLFVWQVAVSEKARGLGLARRMIDHILDREVCEGVEKINTTITRDNAASWALFRSVAARREAPLERDAHFTRDDHFEGRHDTEYMVTIGPFGAEAMKQAAA
ncbi:MAG: diaminobutyrate acetyltransferase [Pseudomonadota bacterium]